MEFNPGEAKGIQVIAYRNSLSQFRSVLDHLFNPLIEDIWRESRRLCGISDVVIGHFVVYPLSIAAEGNGIPHITVTTTPSVIPSAYLRLPGESVIESLPEGVEGFLQSGSPPLYITFGSMMVFEPFNSKTIELAAAIDTGFRAIIQYEGLTPPDIASGSDILLVSKMPHELVFPRCIGIVHHGGAGTSQTAARSCVPSIVIMFAVDQFYWGTLLVNKGVAVSAYSDSLDSH